VTVAVDGKDHPVGGGQLAILGPGGVLIQFRPWPPGWELPGGHCSPGEDPADTAVREAEEETGLRVGRVRLVGVYSWEGLRAAGDAVYVGEVIGGRPRRSIEAWASRYAWPQELPRTTFPWVPQRIADALACAEGAAPVHRVQRITPWHVAAFGTAWMRAPVDWMYRRRRRS
jgi:8-oxo-dGTP pyrophosphatase MutT (NUDIX family)